MVEKIQLQRATEKHLHAIQKMLQENDLPTGDIPDIITELFLACRGTKIIGIGGVERHGDVGLLRSIAIESSLRGKGYGTALCETLIAQAKDNGISNLFLLTMTAEAFFSRLGFEKIQRIEAPQEMQDTTEFKTLCPVSSVCMKIKLEGE
jgi:amino-acid N-acetyltransferase